MVQQDLSWFDMDENGTGALTARLATEATLVKSITGLNLSRYRAGGRFCYWYQIISIALVWKATVCCHVIEFSMCGFVYTRFQRSSAVLRVDDQLTLALSLVFRAFACVNPATAKVNERMSAQ